MEKAGTLKTHVLTWLEKSGILVQQKQIIFKFLKMTQQKHHNSDTSEERNAYMCYIPKQIELR